MRIWPTHHLQKRLSESNTPETVSRWENGARQMGPTAEKLLRLSAIKLSQADEYPVPELEKKMRAEPIRMQLDKEWSVLA